jgi:hypothetical protein
MTATGTCGRTDCVVSLLTMHKQREGNPISEEEEEVFVLLVC